MLIYADKVRLTRSEFARLQEANATHGGRVLGRIHSLRDYLEALIGGLPDEILFDMLEFFETDTSELTRRGDEERAQLAEKESKLVLRGAKDDPSPIRDGK